MDQSGLQSPFSIPTNNSMALDGERHIPLVKRYNAAMHLGHMAAYREALRYAFGRRVLDVGCGTGYGSFFLASYSANWVEALDIHPGALEYARHVYQHPRLRFHEGDALELPFPDLSFDFVFSSQVIEHVTSSEKFLQEIRRVLRPNGFCLITTPNQVIFSPAGAETNPHHINEMDLNVYQAIGAAVFPKVHYRGIPQHCLELLEGDSLPTLKPDSRIHPSDYLVQDHDLETCENLLMYAHKDPNGEFSSTLPQGFASACTTTAPIYYDPHVRAMVSMGKYPFSDQINTFENVPETGKVYYFISPLDALYRIEMDIHSPTRIPFSVELSNKSGKRLHHQEFPMGTTYIEMIFPLQAKATDQKYYILVKPILNHADTSYPIDAIQLMGLKLEENTDKRQDAFEPVIRSFHCNLPAIQW